MAKSSATPLLIAGAGALLLLSSGKKKRVSKSGSTGPGFNNPDPMAPPYPVTEERPKPTPSNDQELWLERQEELVALGYDEVGDTDGVPGANTINAIKLFQGDWNFFSDYLHETFPENDYHSVYSKTSVDGQWGSATESRVDKALGRFDGHEDVYVQDLDRDVRTFREMVNGLKQLPTSSQTNHGPTGTVIAPTGLPWTYKVYAETPIPGRPQHWGWEAHSLDGQYTASLGFASPQAAQADAIERLS